VIQLELLFMGYGIFLDAVALELYFLSLIVLSLSCSRALQVIQLDKHIRLLDSPGVVVATKMADDAAIVLRNCVRVSGLA